jgi:hypothetical protein
MRYRLFVAANDQTSGYELLEVELDRAFGTLQLLCEAGDLGESIPPLRIGVVPQQNQQRLRRDASGSLFLSPR